MGRSSEDIQELDGVRYKLHISQGILTGDCGQRRLGKGREDDEDLRLGDILLTDRIFSSMVTFSRFRTRSRAKTLGTVTLVYPSAYARMIL